MAVTTIIKPDKIILGGALTFEQFETQGIDPALQETMLRPAGHPHPMVIGQQMAQPILEFSTPQLDVVAGIPITGLAYTADSYLYYKEAATTGASGATARATIQHGRIVISQVLVHWTTITLPNRGQAIANVVVSAVYDGTNNPFVYAGTLALPGNLGSEKEFGCGPASVTIAGPTTVAMEPQDVTINSGVELHKESAGSDLWDTFVGIKTTDPSIDITSISKLSIQNFGLSGIALDGATGLLAYARQTGPRVSDATASHIKIVALNGDVIPGRGSTQDGRWAETIRIRPVPADDSTQPITITSGVAIV